MCRKPYGGRGAPTVSVDDEAAAATDARARKPVKALPLLAPPQPVAAVQQEWSLLTREPVESEVVPVCRELGIGIVAYSPLARNLLAGAPADGPPQDWRSNQPRFAAR